MNALPKNKKMLSSADISASMSTVLSYLGSEELTEGDTNYRQILARREELYTIVAGTQEKIDLNAKSAARKTKMVLWAGSGIGIA